MKTCTLVEFITELPEKEQIERKFFMIKLAYIKAINDSKITPKELKMLLGCSKSKVSKILNGQTSLDLLIKTLYTIDKTITIKTTFTND